MVQPPILSICIPTYERPDLLRKTLRSIVNQGVDNNLFEICISDNSASSMTEHVMEEFNSPNIVYKHINPVGSYMNFIKALELGNGKYLKLINDYTQFSEGALIRIINKIKSYADKDNIISWTNGANDNYVGKNIDEYMRIMGINTTWSICFGIWKNDFDRIKYGKSIDEMFPHVSLLFESCKIHHEFIIINDLYFKNLELEKKGGYNIPDVFGRQYTEMLTQFMSDGCIKESTLIILKKEIIDFISKWKALCLFEKKRYTFEFDNDRRTLIVVFGKELITRYYLKYIVNCIILLIKKPFEIYREMKKDSF